MCPIPRQLNRSKLLLSAINPILNHAVKLDILIRSDARQEIGNGLTIIAENGHRM